MALKLFSSTKNEGNFIRVSLLLDGLHLLEVCPSKKWPLESQHNGVCRKSHSLQFLGTIDMQNIDIITATKKRK